MKVCIFIDGQNFYRSLLRFDESLRVDYDRLATWITQAVSGPAAVFGGAYYYVGVSPDAPQLVENFLKGLELRPGYFVKREGRVRRSGRCPACGGEYEYTTEKRVDTRLVADLIHYAANGAYDAAVLVSGDDDFVPAVEAVNSLGKQVWVATWSAEELSTDLRVRCFGQIRLSEGIPAFRVERPRYAERGYGSERAVAAEGGGSERYAGNERGYERPYGTERGFDRPLSAGRYGMPSRIVRPTGPMTIERALVELQRAEARLPHVSRGYFVTRWKSHQLPPAGQEREQLVQQMLERGLIEEFQVTDGEGRTVTAIRSREKDGNVALPETEIGRAHV